MEETYYEESVLKALECCIYKNKKEYAHKLVNNICWVKYNSDDVKMYIEYEISHIFLDKVVGDSSLFWDESKEQIIDIEKRGIELYNDGVDEDDRIDPEKAIDDVNHVFYGMMMAETGKCPKCSDKAKDEFDTWVKICNNLKHHSSLLAEF
jgi:hypothetical protein